MTVASKPTSGADSEAPLRVLFLGHLWQVARALHTCDGVELVGVGIEPQRARSDEAIAWCEAEQLVSFDARDVDTNDRVRELLEGGIDLCVVGAFGQILSEDFLASAQHGNVNVHFAPLPNYRGWGPIEEQILAGETTAGMTIHWITERLDHGPIAAQRTFELGPEDDYDAVFDRAHAAAGEAMSELLTTSVDTWPREPQRGGNKPTPPREPADGEVDWLQTAATLGRLVRADGWRGWVQAPLASGALTIHRARVEASPTPPPPYGTVIEAGDTPLVATGEGALRLLEVTGPPLQPGERLTDKATLQIDAPRVAVMQPTFLPWLGYFSLVADADVFVLLDDFQFRRRSWHHRNQLLRPDGQARWVTLPVEHPGKEERAALNEVRPIFEGAWRRKTIESLRHAYRDAPFFETYFPEVVEWLSHPWEDLASMNSAMIEKTASWLGLETRLERSSQLPNTGKRSARIASVLRAVDARSYLCAAGAEDYMREDGLFPLEDIEVYFQRYEPVTYDQGRDQPFVSHLSALDALLRLGPFGTRAILRRGKQPYKGWGTDDSG